MIMAIALELSLVVALGKIYSAVDGRPGSSVHHLAHLLKGVLVCCEQGQTDRKEILQRVVMNALIITNDNTN